MTTTGRPTDGIGFNGHHPGVAAQIAGSNLAPDRPAETGHLAADQGHQPRDWPEPAISLRPMPFPAPNRDHATRKLVGDHIA